MTIERLLEAGRALDDDRLEQAQRIYHQVADADPRSSIAIVGLARVAQRRGDGAAAAQLAEAALAIDPGNVAARRLLREHNAPGSDAAAGPSDVDEGWPWPDLDDQLRRYREPGPGPLARLLKRR